MVIWLFLFVIFLAGAIGGSVNAFLSNNGFIMPKKVKGDRGNRIYQPGFLGNTFIGGIAACMSWGLYGPFADAYIIVDKNSGASNEQLSGLSVSALVGAVIVGIGGARWLTNEVDKTILRTAGTHAALSDKNEHLARDFVSADPKDVLHKAALHNRETSQLQSYSNQTIV